LNKPPKFLVVVVTLAILAIALFIAFGGDSPVLPPPNATIGLLSMVLFPILVVGLLYFFVIRPR
jgi:VIT1/CCC1 family predicted Fe2+/Mn2+ transporter